MGLPETNIKSVTSDHVDASRLPVTVGQDSNATTFTFTLPGMVDVDPLSLPGNAIVNEHTALTIPAYYSGVRFICETIAGLPKQVFQRTDQGPKRVSTHPAEWAMNEEPSGLNTPFTFWSTFLLHAINWSDGFAAYRAGPGDPQCFNLPPDRVYPFRFDGKQWYAFDLEKPQKAGDPNSRFLIFAAEEMIHLPALSFDGMSGLPMVRLMQGALRTSKNTEAYVDKYFGQGGMLRGSMETDQPLSKEQMIEYTDLIKNRYSGVDNAHKWMVLGNGLKAKTLTPELDTAQTEENRKFSVQEVCRMLRVPPHIVYELGKATWANIESLGIEVVKYTLNNWVKPLEQELTRKLLTRPERKSGYYIRFDVAALMRGDHAAQIDGAVKRVNNGITTPDEERADLGLAPYPDGVGAVPRVAANTLPLEVPAEPTPPPQADDDEEEELSATVEKMVLEALKKVTL